MSQNQLEELCAYHRIDLKEVIASLEEKRITVAWVSGSIVEGLGNPSSDLDVYTVVPRLHENGVDSIRHDDTHQIEVYFSNARRIDVEYWAQEPIEALALKLSTAPIGDSSKNILDYFSEAEVEFIHRLHIGIPVLGEAAFRVLQGRFCRERLSRYLFENKRIYLDDAFDDTVGLLEEGDLLSATFRVRCALDFSADILLYALGVTNHKDKHRYRLLECMAQDYPRVGELYRSYIALMALMPRGVNQLTSHVKDCLVFSEEVVRAVYKELG